jgi:hypothetical protein
MAHGTTGSIERGQPDRFPLLFTPLRLGPVTIPNRIVSSGHDTVMAVDGKVSDQMVAYHAARADGGAGLIVVQVAAIHSSARYSSHILMADDDTCIPGLARLASAVRSRGTPIFQQLFHDGRELMESADGTLPVAYAPSAVPNERFAVRPRETGSRGPAWTASRSSPRTATCPLSSSTRVPTCGTTSSAARPPTGSGSCARRSRPRGGAPDPGWPSGSGSRSARSQGRQRA